MATTITSAEQNPLLDIQFPPSAPSAPKPWELADNFERILTVIEVAADFASLFLSVECTYFLARIYGHSWTYSIAQTATLGVSFAALFVLMLDRQGGYRSGNSLLRVKETERVLRVSGQSYVLMLAVSFFLGHQMFSRSWISVLAPCAFIFVLVEKQIVYATIRALHSRGIGVRKVIIVGAGYTGRRVFGALVRSPKLGLCPVAAIDNEGSHHGSRIFAPGYKREYSIAVKSGPLTTELLYQFGAEMVILAVPTLTAEGLQEALGICRAAGARVAFVPNHHACSDRPDFLEHVDIDGLLLSSIPVINSRHVLSAILKRIFDVIAGTAIALLMLPLMLCLALAIYIESGSPALFVQTRIGRSGHPFRLYKFRTMRVEASAYDYSPVASEDPRITRMGRWLRRISFDELPQLFNVICGDMSLVGPRPEMPFIVQQYTDLERQRLSVCPGITGLWQLSADRAFLIHENIEYDLYYIKNRNFCMDIAILLHTLFFAMRGI